MENNDFFISEHSQDLLLGLFILMVLTIFAIAVYQIIKELNKE